MAIELHVRLSHPVRLEPLLPKARQVLAEMLGVSSVPELTLSVLDRGERHPAVNGELRDESSPQFLISLSGEAETVDLIVPGTHVGIGMGFERTYLEYALGAAVAVAVARDVGGLIEDDWHFFSDQAQVSPDDLVHRLKVPGRSRDYREAAERLSGRLGSEPNQVNSS